MAEFSYFWGGTSVGDATAAPYSDDEFTDVTEFLMTYDRTIQGVLPTIKTGYIGNLEVSNAGGSTARVAPGAALVDGKLYASSGNVDFVVSGAAVHWLIGLRKDFTAQTVRAFARGNYGSSVAAIASLVQIDGTTWEIPLATVLTTAGGAVSSITDYRTFVGRIADRVVFVPATSVYNLTGTVVNFPLEDGLTEPGVVLDDAANCYSQFTFRRPDDYVSGGVIDFIVKPDASGNLYTARIDYYMLIIGESRADGTGGLGFLIPTAEAVVADTTQAVFSYDISAFFNPFQLGEGAMVSVVFRRSGDDVLDTVGAAVSLIGMRFSYTAGV